jgi:hypothetical protein
MKRVSKAMIAFLFMASCHEAFARGYRCEFLANDHLDRVSFDYSGEMLMQRELPGARILIQPYPRGQEEKVTIHQLKLVLGKGPSQLWSVSEYEQGAPSMRAIIGHVASSATIECLKAND